MLYSLEPVKVKATPGSQIGSAMAAAKSLSHTLKCDVWLNFNGTIHVVNGESVVILSNFK